MRSNLPQYGSCWRQALQHVQESCNRLSEDTQADMALQLANCFLEMSGEESYHCESERKPNLRKICISNMSDKAFNAYTEFYIHTQNICWFLQSQIWQEVIVEQTYQVGKQIEASAENQGRLLNAQKESLAAQERALKHSIDLKEIVETTKNSIASSQETILGIQNWLINEMSWFDTVLFYIISLSFAFIFTSVRSSNASRLPVLILLFGGVLSERFICQIFLAFNNQDVNNSHKLLLKLIWFFRYTLVALCVTVIIYSICYFKDYDKINNELLLKIHLQNEKLAELLKNQRKSFDDNVLHENEFQKHVITKKISESNHNLINSPVKDGNAKTPLNRSLGNIELKKYNLRSREVTPQMI